MEAPSRIRTLPATIKIRQLFLIIVGRYILSISNTSFFATNCVTLYHKVHVPRVPQCLSPRLNWDPHPLSRKRVCTPTRNQRGDSRLRVRGWGVPNRMTGEKAYCPLCLYSVVPITGFIVYSCCISS
jgi:hypothetical protein